MNTRYVWGLVGLGGLGAAIAGFLARRAKTPKFVPAAPSSILLVGDSLGVGLAEPLKSLGLPLSSIAKEGTTIAYWLSLGKADLEHALKSKPTWVFVSLGTNDAYDSTNTPAKASAATSSFLDLCFGVGAGAQVFWIGPPSLPTSYGRRQLDRSIIDAIQQMVERTSASIWLDNAVVNIPRQGDQLHPTGPGYTAWAKLIVDELAQFFVEPGPSESGTKAASLGDDAEEEPSPRPPPPSEVTLPAGWVRMPQATRSMMVFALSVLAQRRPIGDLQTATVDGRQVGALTEWHWDNHVDHVWKWHRGISLLVPLK